MTTAAPSALGFDILVDAATEDADAMFTAGSGLAVVKQDVRHRLLTDSVLGPGGIDWGYNIRKLAGATTKKITSIIPELQNVVMKDERIRTVRVTAVVSGDGPTRAVAFKVMAETGLGPFRLIIGIDSSKATADLVATLEAQ